jgi:hypothetical protein
MLMIRRSTESSGKLRKNRSAMTTGAAALVANADAIGARFEMPTSPSAWRRRRC